MFDFFERSELSEDILTKLKDLGLIDKDASTAGGGYSPDEGLITIDFWFDVIEKIKIDISDTREPVITFVMSEESGGREIIFADLMDEKGISDYDVLSGLFEQFIDLHIEPEPSAQPILDLTLTADDDAELYGVSTDTEIAYKLAMENTGNAPAENITLTQSLGYFIFLEGDINNDEKLDPNETWIYNTENLLVQDIWNDDGEILQEVTVVEGSGSTTSASLAVNYFEWETLQGDDWFLWGEDSVVSIPFNMLEPGRVRIELSDIKYTDWLPLPGDERGLDYSDVDYDGQNDQPDLLTLSVFSNDNKQANVEISTAAGDENLVVTFVVNEQDLALGGGMRFTLEGVDDIVYGAYSLALSPNSMPGDETLVSFMGGDFIVDANVLDYDDLGRISTDFYDQVMVDDEDSYGRHGLIVLERTADCHELYALQQAGVTMQTFFNDHTAFGLINRHHLDFSAEVMAELKVQIYELPPALKVNPNVLNGNFQIYNYDVHEDELMHPDDMPAKGNYTLMDTAEGEKAILSIVLVDDLDIKQKLILLKEAINKVGDDKIIDYYSFVHPNLIAVLTDPEDIYDIAALDWVEWVEAAPSPHFLSNDRTGFYLSSDEDGNTNGILDLLEDGNGNAVLDVISDVQMTIANQVNWNGSVPFYDGITGVAVNVAVHDSTQDPQQPDLGNQVCIIGTAGGSDHGTHVAGIALGTGVALGSIDWNLDGVIDLTDLNGLDYDGDLTTDVELQWHGMAPEANLISLYSSNNSIGVGGGASGQQFLYASMNDADYKQALAGNECGGDTSFPADVMNHSHVFETNTSYSAAASGWMDQIIQGDGYARGIPHVFAASNNGSNPQWWTNPANATHGSQAEIFSIGNSSVNAIIVANWNASANNLSPGSSVGPYGDFSLGMTVAAPGSNIWSTTIVTDTNSDGLLEDGDGDGLVDLYVSKSGTSMAAPVVTGMLALLLDVWRDTYLDSEGYTLEDAALSPAGLRAIAMNTAHDVTFGAANGALVGSTMTLNSSVRAALTEVDTDDDPTNGVSGGSPFITPGPDIFTGAGLINPLAAVELVAASHEVNGRTVPDSIIQDSIQHLETFQYEFKITKEWIDAQRVSEDTNGNGVLDTGEDTNDDGEINLRQSSLKITLAWDDQPATAQTPVTSPLLVNDLDLKVISSDSQTTYYPWTLGVRTYVENATGNPILNAIPVPGDKIIRDLPNRDEPELSNVVGGGIIDDQNLLVLQGAPNWGVNNDYVPKSYLEPGGILTAMRLVDDQTSGASVWYSPDGYTVELARATDHINNFEMVEIQLTEDRNLNKVLDLSEDANSNGVLDPGEDTNGNGVLDASEDINGNGNIDTIQPGTYYVQVSGFSVPQGPQEFALVGLPRPDLPDLVVMPTSKVALDAGKPLNVTFMVENIGDIAVNTTSVKSIDYAFYLSKDIAVGGDHRIEPNPGSELILPWHMTVNNPKEYTAEITIDNNDAVALLGLGKTVKDLAAEDVFLLVRVDDVQSGTPDVKTHAEGNVLEHHEANIGVMQIARAVDVVLLMDVSGSMGWDMTTSSGPVPKIDLLIDAVEVFLDVFRVDAGDSIGGVTFESSVDVLDFGVNNNNSTLVDYTSAGSAGIKTVVNAISVGNMTDIEAGLQKAQEYFDDDDKNKVLIFLSDGVHTAGGNPLDEVTNMIDDDIQVFAVGFGAPGDDLDMNLLQALTASTGGFMQRASDWQTLDEFFVMAVAGAIGEDVVLDPQGTVYGNGVSTSYIDLTNQAGSVTIVLTNDGTVNQDRLDIVLTTPSGLILDEDNDGDYYGVDYQETFSHDILTVVLPQPSFLSDDDQNGLWKIEVINKTAQTQDYTLSVLGDTTIHAAVTQPMPDSCGVGGDFTECLFGGGDSVKLQLDLSSNIKNSDESNVVHTSDDGHFGADVIAVISGPVNSLRSWLEDKITNSPSINNNIDADDIDQIITAQIQEYAQQASGWYADNEQVSDEAKALAYLKYKGMFELETAYINTIELTQDELGVYTGSFNQTRYKGDYEVVYLLNGSMENCDPFQREFISYFSVESDDPDPDDATVINSGWLDEIDVLTPGSFNHFDVVLENHQGNVWVDIQQVDSFFDVFTEISYTGFVEVNELWLSADNVVSLQDATDDSALWERAQEIGGEYRGKSDDYLLVAAQVRGDLNNDGRYDVLDVVSSINVVLSNTAESSADVNFDGTANVLDVVASINAVLSGVQPSVLVIELMELRIKVIPLR